VRDEPRIRPVGNSTINSSSHVCAPSKWSLIYRTLRQAHRLVVRMTNRTVLFHQQTVMLQHGIETDRKTGRLA